MTTIDQARGEIGHLFPQFLPDGEHRLFVAGRPGPSDVFVTSLASAATPSLLLPASSRARYTPLGYLLFGRGSSVMAQPFDVEHLSVRGAPVRVAAEVAGRVPIPGFGLDFSISQQGDLAYVGAGASALTQLRWLDRSGADLGMMVRPGDYQNPALSPDATRIAVQRDGDLWLLEPSRGTERRFTFDPALDVTPIWSPDGARIVFSSDREGSLGLYEKEAAGATPPRLLLESDIVTIPTDWSRDGALVSYTTVTTDTFFDLWLLPMSGDRHPTSLVATPFSEGAGMLAPDGRWMAYSSDESGRREVFVQSVPPSGGKWQISTAGGVDARWRRDGRELYDLSLNNELMVVDIETAGDAPMVGIPHALFQVPFRQVPPQRNSFDVTADGQRFLVNTLVEGAGSAPITWVLNWMAELER